MKKQQIVIDTKAILTGIGVIGLLWVAAQIQTILLALFISLIIALALTPAVEYLTKKKLPKWLSVFIIYFGSVLVILGISALAFGPLVNQTITLANELPTYLDSLAQNPQLEYVTTNFNTELANQFSSISGNAVQTTLGAFSSAVLILTTLVFTAYLLHDFKGVKEFFVDIFPKKERNNIEDVIQEIEEKLGYWLRGQISLMLIIGIITYIGLLLLRVDFALSLAVIAGILEIVPIIGPIIALVPAVIVGFGGSTVKGIGVIGLYILIQQLENNFIVPKVMQKAVGLNPLVTMIVILIGGKLFGIVGAILSVPTTIIAIIVFKNLYENHY